MLSTRLLRFAVVTVGTVMAYASTIETWCGKVYSADASEIIPAGWLRQPAVSPDPLLDVQINPRFTIYVEKEETAEFIIDAGFSPYHGKQYNAPLNSAGSTPWTMQFVVNIGGNVTASGIVGVNTTNNLLSFDLTSLTPRLRPYPVSLVGTINHSNDTFTASTELSYLPDKSTGSIVKIDNLYGALHYKNRATNGSFKPLFPFGFYADYSKYLNVSQTNTQAYKNHGFNAVIPESAFTDGNMTHVLDELDNLDLPFQYDMRGSFSNLSSVRQQVPHVIDHPSLLTWYTADEPDGWMYPFNSTTLAYELLASLDRYHPTALVLNCQNHWFKPYTVGADIILEDAYPVGISPHYSLRWNTTCNATYGDCGCDNCGGHLTDVSDRIDDFYTYGTWIGGKAARKPVWAVNQAMSGQSYWSRSPTDKESWVMDILALNHGAKGRLAWIYPPSEELIRASSQLAKVVTTSPVVDFLVGANPSLIHNGKHAQVDASFWAVDKGESIMVGIANPRNVSIDEAIEILLPVGNTRKGTVTSEIWGSVGWTLNGTRLIAKEGLAGLDTSLIILS